MANRRASTEMRRMQMRVAQRQAQRYGGASTPLLQGTNNDGSFRAMAEGGTVGGTAPPMKLPPVPQPTLSNRKAVLDALEDQATNPAPAQAPAAQEVPPNPLQTQVVPGLADQMAARQAARMKTEADEAMKNAAGEPKKAGFVQSLRSRIGFANGGYPGDDGTEHMNNPKHFGVWSGGMANGGPVGLRHFAMGGDIGYSGVQPRHPAFGINTEASSPWNTESGSIGEMGDWGRPPGGSIARSYGPKGNEPQTIYNYSMADGGQLPLDPKWAAANHPLLMMYKHYADGGYLTDDRYDHTTIPRGQRYPAHGMGPDLDVRQDAKYKQFFGLRTHEDDMNGTVGTRQNQAQMNPHFANGGEIQIQRAVFANGGWVFPGAVSTAQNGMRANTNVNPQNGFPFKVDGGSVGPLQVYPNGGPIQGKGGPTEDRQPVLASPKEYILPADTVEKVGKHNLDKLRHATHTPVHKHGMRGMNMGGEPVDLPTPPVKGFALGGQIPGSQMPVITQPMQRLSSNSLADLTRPGELPGVSSFTPSSMAPQAPGQADNSAPGYKWDKSRMSFNPAKPTSVAEAPQTGINPKTGYPMLADGGMPTGLRGWPKMADGSWVGNAWDWTKDKFGRAKDVAQGAAQGAQEAFKAGAPEAAPAFEGAATSGEVPSGARDWTRAGSGPNPAQGEFNFGPRSGTSTPGGTGGSGLGPDLAERAGGQAAKQSLRGAAWNAAKTIGEHATRPGWVGLGLATHPTETSEPTDTQIPQNTGMKLTPEAAALSDRERYKLIQDVNSGDPMKSAAAKQRLIGAKPEPFAAPTAPTPEGIAAGPPAPSTEGESVRVPSKNITEQTASPAPVNTTDWAAKLRDYNTQKQQENQQLTQGWERQNNLSNRNQALYEARVAGENLRRFPQDQGLRGQYADAMGRAGMFGQQVNLADTHATELARAKLGTEAAKYGHEMGLRGQMIGAEANVLGHRIGAEAGLAGHQINAQLRLAELQRSMGKENWDDAQKLFDRHATENPIDEKTGKPGAPQVNTATRAALEEYVLSPAVNNRAFLSKFGHNVDNIRQIPPDQWEPILHDAKVRLGIVGGLKAGANEPGFSGMPTGVTVKPSVEFKDIFSNRWTPGTSQVTLGDWANAKFNPAAKPQDQMVATISTAGRPTHKITLSEMANDPKKARAVIESVRQNQGDEAANNLATSLRIGLPRNP